MFVPPRAYFRIKKMLLNISQSLRADEIYLGVKKIPISRVMAYIQCAPLSLLVAEREMSTPTFASSASLVST